MPKVHLHVTVDEDVRDALRKFAGANGISLAAAVNLALRRGLPVLTGAAVSGTRNRPGPPSD